MAECVQVAVSNATFHFDKLYSYSVPAHLQDRVFVGSMVLVPFGRGAAARMGGVLGLDAPEAAGKRLKSLYDAAPEQARLSEELLHVCIRYGYDNLRSRPSFPTERSTKL